MSVCYEFGTAFAQALIYLIITTILWGSNLNTKDHSIKPVP